MPSITIAKSPMIGDGVFITYTGTANVCSYWEVVEFLNPGEGPGLGSFVEKCVLTNGDGIAVNQYLASTDVADVGKIERVKVSEGA